jgi:hypothetical protein
MIAFLSSLTDSEKLAALCALAFALFFWGFLFRTRV